MQARFTNFENVLIRVSVTKQQTLNFNALRESFYAHKNAQAQAAAIKNNSNSFFELNITNWVNLLEGYNLQYTFKVILGFVFDAREHRSSLEVL